MNLSPKARSYLKRLIKEFDLNLVILFGSRARDRIHPQSDTDIAVRGKKRLTIKERLKLSREFDRIFVETDLSDIRNAPPLLLASIAQNSQLLFEKTKGDFAQFKVSSINQFIDSMPLFDKRRKVNEKFFKELKLS